MLNNMVLHLLLLLINIGRLWISAAAACLAVMVVATALLFQQDSPQHVYKVQATEMSGDRFVDEAADYAMIDNTDIYAYLEDN